MNPCESTYLGQLLTYEGEFFLEFGGSGEERIRDEDFFTGNVSVSFPFYFVDLDDSKLRNTRHVIYLEQLKKELIPVNVLLA